MRTVLVLSALALALAGCNKGGAPAAANAGDGAGMATPARKAGLWQVTTLRDGQPSGRLGDGKPIKICLDAATDAKMNIMGGMGGRMGRRVCSDQRSTKAADGSYSFSSTCQIGPGGTMTTKGTITGDFSTKYVVHSEVDVSGASFDRMNGHHVNDVTGEYQGPCPADMAGGDVMLADGTKGNFGDLMRQLRGNGGGGGGEGGGGGGGGDQGGGGAPQQ